MERFVEKKGIKKWFKRDNLIILVLSGILLLIIALPTKGTGKSGAGGDGQGQAGTKTVLDAGGAGGAKTQGTGGTSASGGTSAGGAGAAGGDGVSYAGGTGGLPGGGFAGDYTGYLEQKLKETLTGMAGVGRVSVMITLASSEELVVEKDEPVSRTNTTESDSAGGSRSIYEVENSPQTIYRTQGSDSEPYVVKTLLPKVEGVVVVAEGAGTGSTSKNITEVVQALFDIEANKIKVVKGGV